MTDHRMQITSEIELTPGLQLFLGKTKQAWRIIEVDREQKTALLLLEKPVKPRPYHLQREAVTWEHCSLRSWLNDEFLEIYFSPTEKAAIVESELTNPDFPARNGTFGGNDTRDKAFLLSRDEAEKLNSLQPWKDENDEYCWLRSPGYDQNTASLACGLGPAGHLNADVNRPHPFRPAVRVDLNNAVFQKLIGTGESHPFTIQLPDLTIRTDHALYAAITNLYVQKGGLWRWYQMKLYGKEMPRLLLKNGEEASESLLRVLIMEAWLCSQEECNLLPDPAVEALEGSLSAVSLHAAVDRLCELLDEQTAPSLLPAICRYGSGVQLNRPLSRLITYDHKWMRFAVYGKHVRYKNDAIKRYGIPTLVLLERCLCLSDTHAAAFWLEKNANLERYAAVRQQPVEKIRKWDLFDFGFDRNGRKYYDLGGVTVEASLSQKFKILLKDPVSRQMLRCLPVENTDPELQRKAKDDLDDLRRNMSRAVKLLRDELYEDFLSGAETAADIWNQRWVENGLCRRLAEQLVWEQEGRRFVLSEHGLEDCSMSEYTLSDAPIKLAHPMEIPPNEVQFWKRYADEVMLRQPFRQIWEPVIAQEEFRSDRYLGRRISCYRLRHQEARGIHWIFGIEGHLGGYDTEHLNFDMDDFSWKAYRVGRTGSSLWEGDLAVGSYKWLEFASLEPKGWNRRINAVIAYFDQLARPIPESDKQNED